jgi:hypothetical protein
LAPENLHTGDHLLCLPMTVLFLRESARAIFSLARFIFSDEAVALFEKTQPTALPASTRRQ